MTDEEIRRIQQENGNSEMFLHQRGMFWNAYDGAAFALARVTECQLKKRKATNRYELGFSKSELPKVLMQMEEHGMKVTRDSRNLKLIRFSGGNTEPDDELLNSRKKRKTGPTKAEIKTLLEIRAELLDINLADETMNYTVLSRLVRRLQVKCLTKLDL